MGFTETYAYGFWSMVVFNIVVFSLFAYSAFRPSTKRDWRTLGAFTAFLVALFSEMFGFPLTIYILTSILGSRYPVLNPYSHMNGHLWVTLAGGSPVLFNILHPLSNIMIFSGLIIITIGWKKIHAGSGKMVTDGIYKYVRHPQYVGFSLAILGFLVQWPTIITMLMAPILMYMYTRLSKAEEKYMLEAFGEEYRKYAQRVPPYFPRLKNNSRRVHDIGYNKA